MNKQDSRIRYWKVPEYGNREVYYPITIFDAVRDANGRTLTEVLRDMGVIPPAPDDGGGDGGDGDADTPVIALPIAADQVLYSDGRTVQQVLSDILYEPIRITTLSVAPKQVAMGATVNGVVLTVATNTAIAELYIDNVLTEVTGNGQYSIEGEFTAKRTFEVRVVDARGTAVTQRVTLAFDNYVYYGCSALALWEQPELLVAMPNKLLTDTRKRTISVDAAAGERIIYAIPSRLGTPTFTVGGFAGGFEQMASAVQIANTDGYSEPYMVWASVQQGLGATTIVIS